MTYIWWTLYGKEPNATNNWGDANLKYNAISPPVRIAMTKKIKDYKFLEGWKEKSHNIAREYINMANVETQKLLRKSQTERPHEELER